MTQQEIDSIISNQMKNLAPQVIAARCQQLTSPSAVVVPRGGVSGTDNYQSWLNYVAAHIEANTAFESDCDTIANRADWISTRKYNDSL